MALSENIKRRRMELRMSQQELAEAVGYRSRSTIAKIEAGQNDIPQNKVATFARALDTSVEYLLTGYGSLHETISGVLSQENAERLVGANKTAEDFSEGVGSLSNKNIAVILAGGKSTRNQQNVPNQFIEIHGKPMIIYVLETYQRHPMIDEIYVVCLRGWDRVVAAYAEQFGITKMRGIIPGGSSGMGSIKKAFETIADSCDPDDIIILQESTRPLVSSDSINRLLLACAAKNSAVTSEPMYGHLQFYCGENDRAEYLDRNRIMDVQSPEAYRFSVMQDVFDMLQSSEREELLKETYFSFVYHSLGNDLNFVEGSGSNIKAVHAEDIPILSALIR